MDALATSLLLGDPVQRFHQPRLDHLVLFQLLAAIVHRLEEVIEIGILGHLDARDLHMFEEVVTKGCQSGTNQAKLSQCFADQFKTVHQPFVEGTTTQIVGSNALP
ncbi:hypothetical protein D3C72_2248220 [compost metagenome]